jgi:SAM-dependent methyltransferase
MTEEMVRYYARRAAEYDRIYEITPWREGLAVLRQRVPGFFRGRRVFEVACGTGYWTQYAARAAVSVQATDLNEETLAIARSRLYRRGNVAFERADAYATRAGPPAADAGLAAFWLSHVDRGRMADFLAAFHSHLAPASPVLMFDERPEDRGLDTSRTDDAGNRYEMRRLHTGERFEIIKNFYDGPALAALLASPARDLAYEEIPRFWVLSYVTRA